ncbi:MAG: ABC transporter permease [Nannocystaceae bacterium]
MNQLLIVLRKELRDAIRDRRSVLSALIYPVITPLILVFVFQMAADEAKNPPPMRLAIAGMEHAPGLVEELKANEVELEEMAREDLADAVRAGEVPAALDIPAHFGERFREGWPAPAYLYEDGAARQERRTASRIHRVIASYSGTVGSLRLVAMGVSPAASQAIQLTTVDLSSSKARAAELMNFIPILVLFACFMSGMYVAMDVTAGERERGSLEPLLLTASDLRMLVLGKTGAALVFALAGSVLTLAGCVFAFGQLPLEELGLSVSIHVGTAARILLLMGPLAVLATGMQIFVATFARTIKEAQTYLSLFILIPMFPVMFLSVKSPALTAWLAPVPLLGQYLMTTELMAGRQVALSYIASSGLAAAVVGMVAVWGTARLLGKERVIFGRG